MDWNGLVCVVTGASSGFGNEVCRQLARRGVKIVASARREDKLRELVDSLGDGHSVVVCDVTDLASIRTAVADVEKKFGKVDVLINNAGIPSAGRFSEASSEEMQRVIVTNLLGPLWCTKEYLRLLGKADRKERTPIVVNVASMAGRIPIPRSADYAASKFGLVGFTESVWADLRDLGIRSMVVNPGPAETEGFVMDDVKANRITAWTVMDARRVAAAIIRGVERGSNEVRVQWWLHPLYHATVLLGPLRRYVSLKVRGQFRGQF